MYPNGTKNGPFYFDDGLDNQLETVGTSYDIMEAFGEKTNDVIYEDDFIRDATYIIENAEILEPQENTQAITKRYRMNPKQQKEVIEKLFKKRKALVIPKAFMNAESNKRIKSDVWAWFGDIKLLINQSEAKELEIPHYFRKCVGERIMISKQFVGCFNCNALFIHNSKRSGTSTLRSHTHVCSRPCSRRRRGDPTIIFFPKKDSRQASQIASEDDKLLAQKHMLDFVLSTESVFDVFEETELQRLLQLCISVGANFGDIDIESILCPLEHLSEFSLNDLYEACVDEFYTEFQYSYGATFTINLWSWVIGKQENSYINIFCHYSTPSGKLKNIILHTDEFNSMSDTPKDMIGFVNSFLSEMVVVPIKRLVVADNISYALCNEEHIGCAYQNLNLALQTAVEKAMNIDEVSTDFRSLVTACNDIVNYFRQISLQYQLPEPLKSYKEDSWTSIIDMFRSIHNQFEDISNILNVIGNAHLLSVEKTHIAAVIGLFQVFEKAQIELSNRNLPTLNTLVPWVTKLQKHCLEVFSDFTTVQQLKVIIAAELNDRLTSNITVFHRIATMLDPRFKHFVFPPEEEQIAANTKLKYLVNECIEISSTEANRFSSDKSSKDTFSSDVYPWNAMHDSRNDEIDNYFHEPFSQDLDQHQKFNPLEFWTEKSKIYPNLNKVALWILSCPAFTVQKEESLWTAPFKCCQRRQKSDVVNKVLFVKSFKYM